MISVIPVILNSLPPELLPAAAKLDQSALGGLWTVSGYQQELERPSSDLLGIWSLQPISEMLSQAISPQRRLGKRLQDPLAEPAVPILLATGCAWSIVDESHLTLLAVQPDLRRYGLGSAMLMGLLKAAHSRGLRQATLEVRASNQAAVTLYQKFGFKSIGVRPSYYSPALDRPAEDALILWRSGLQSEGFLAEMNQRWQAIESRLRLQRWQLEAPV